MGLVEAWRTRGHFYVPVIVRNGDLDQVLGRYQWRFFHSGASERATWIFACLGYSRYCILHILEIRRDWALCRAMSDLYHNTQYIKYAQRAPLFFYLFCVNHGVRGLVLGLCKQSQKASLRHITSEVGEVTKASKERQISCMMCNIRQTENMLRGSSLHKAPIVLLRG